MRALALLSVLMALPSGARAEIYIDKEFGDIGPNGEVELSPPNLEPTSDCSSYVFVDSFVPLATVHVYLNGSTIIGTATPPNGFAAIQLTQKLHLNDKVTAKQTVNGKTSAASKELKIEALPATLPKPAVDPNVYVCGRVAPVHNLISGVTVDVYDAATNHLLGSGQTPNLWGSDWAPVGVSALTMGQKVIAKQSSSCVAKPSGSSPAVPVKNDPHPMLAPTYPPPVVGNDTIELSGLYNGALVEAKNTSPPPPEDDSGYATSPNNYVQLTNPITGSENIKITESLCKDTATTEPQKPVSKLDPPTLVGPICPDASFVQVAGTTLNATLILLKNGKVVGYGGAAPGNATLTIAPPNTFALNDTVEVIQYINAIQSPKSNTVTVGCKVFVRPSVATLTAAQIASLRKGFSVMMSRPATDPTSFRFQAAIHATQDMPTTSLESSGWNQCEHGSYYFFSWHRMYLYFFERILRKASGDPNLALPYWNWTDPAQRALPMPFEQPADPSNPLYIAPPDRPTGVDDGTALLDDGTVSYSTAFGYTNFLSPTGSGLSFGGQQASPAHFNMIHGELESQPHDVVHGALGGLMSDPLTASLDPIFYLHHANVDRLWKRWIAQGGGRADPTGDSNWMNTTFDFFDENGNAVHLTGSQVIDTVTQLDYRYDDDPIPAGGQMRRAPPFMVAAAESPQTLATSSPDPTQLAEAPVTVSLPLPQALAGELKTIVAADAGRKLVLEVEGIQFDKAPTINYEVYLDLPKDEKPTSHSPSYVGSLAFFGLKPHAMPGHPDDMTMNGIRQFDITKVAADLMAKGTWNANELSVSFVPHGLVGRDGEPLPIEPGPRATFGKMTLFAE